MLSPFHGTIEKNEDGTLDLQPGLLETEAMQERGHEEAGLDRDDGGGREHWRDEE